MSRVFITLKINGRYFMMYECLGEHMPKRFRMNVWHVQLELVRMLVGEHFAKRVP